MVTIRKEDVVRVIAGDDKGKTGVVSAVLSHLNKVVVDGINISKRHQKPDRDGNGGGIIEKPMPIHISNVKVVSKRGETASV